VRHYVQEGNGAEARFLISTVPPDKQGWETDYLSNYLFGQQTTFHTGQAVRRVAFTPDGRYVLAGTGPLSFSGFRMWDTATGRESRRFYGPAPSSRSVDALVNFGCSPDGKYLVAVDAGACISVYDFASGQVVRQFGEKRMTVVSAALSADGTILATGEKDG